MINGSKLSEEIIEKVAKQVKKNNLKLGLAAILIGDNKASKIYLKLKKKACHDAGIEFHDYLLSSDAQEKDILSLIDFLNNDPDITSIIVQLPLPKGFNTDKIINAISPLKDVDGFHKQNLDNFYKNKPCIVSGLCLGIMELIESAKVKLDGKKAVIICNSIIFGKPLEKLLKEKKIKPKTILANNKDIKKETLNSDIIIVAAGKKDFLTADMVNKDAIIIDVGINKVKGKTYGDCDFEEISKKTEYISPVPGGVGPMTVAMLLENILNCYKLQKK